MLGGNITSHLNIPVGQLKIPDPIMQLAGKLSKEFEILGAENSIFVR